MFYNEPIMREIRKRFPMWLGNQLCSNKKPESHMNTDGHSFSNVI